MAAQRIPAQLMKKIKFVRLPTNVCSGYNVYGVFKDPGYASGVRKELLDEIVNPGVPSVEIVTILLKSTGDPTWTLPEEAFLDREHPFRLKVNNTYLSSMYYSYNKVNRLISIDTELVAWNYGDKVELEYYRDVINTRYFVPEDCEIIVQPIFISSASIGEHNVIL